MMKISIVILLAASYLGCHGYILRLPETPIQNPKCEKLSNYLLKFLDIMKTENPMQYRKVDLHMRILLNVRIDDKKKLKNVICLFASVKNLRELSNMGNPLSYHKILQLYRSMQREVISAGGYRNARRVLEVYYEFKDWINSLKVNNPAEIKNSHNVTEVEHFFKLMQMKYGSRWLSLPVLAENQDLLITNPTDFAKNFFECSSLDDLVTRTGIQQKYADVIWKLFREEGKVPLGNLILARQNLDFIIEGELLFGELGLYDLE